jgi:hypothetical protein
MHGNMAISAIILNLASRDVLVLLLLEETRTTLWNDRNFIHIACARTQTMLTRNHQSGRCGGYHSPISLYGSACWYTHTMYATILSNSYIHPTTTGHM